MVLPKEKKNEPHGWVNENKSKSNGKFKHSSAVNHNEWGTVKPTSSQGWKTIASSRGSEFVDCCSTGSTNASRGAIFFILATLVQPMQEIGITIVAMAGTTGILIHVVVQSHLILFIMVKPQEAQSEHIRCSLV